LLELVLVMVIIGTVLAMAAPSLRGFFASRQTEDAAASIVALTRLARSQAAVEGRVYRLNFDLKEMKYWLTVQSEGAFRNLSSEFGRVFLLPEGTELELKVEGVPADRDYVSFQPTGRTEAATIRLKGRQGESVNIACLSPTESYKVVAVPEGQDE
jgi:type II secretory pathway pseudopilin PulG